MPLFTEMMPFSKAGQVPRRCCRADALLGHIMRGWRSTAYDWRSRVNDDARPCWVAKCQFSAFDIDFSLSTISLMAQSAEELPISAHAPRQAFSISLGAPDAERH